ncbi:MULTISPECIES: hypothetical protein [Clostridium]|uniref:Uncharacterized protein n=1 Tax=Clostridium frigoriphilum TaxID=443253 RepID=A0ABU7UXN2_9CLOT|nr:hypothetical protein [Clostridium sp. DSM 17811]
MNEINILLIQWLDNLRYLSDNDVVNSVIYSRENDKHILTYEDDRMEFTYLQIKEIISVMIDLLEKIHPLGTVVQLKNIFNMRELYIH